ncbi:DUF4390 domain-containing protein [Desulfovibrio sp. OttesenSCG-928-F07]|nr:DUF4390 domain-containing protein [Desulfovibrio sp. OttesenSCG-928-F07]
MQLYAAGQNSFAYEEPVLFKRGGKLWVKLPLSVTDEAALIDLLRDRATLELQIETLVQRKRSLWFNEDLTKNNFVSVVRHDPLSREFKLTHIINAQVMSNSNLRPLLAVSWKKNELPLIELSALKPSETYIIEIDLALRHSELPSWLERTLVFWDKNIVNTEHLTLEYKLDDATVSR